MFGLKYRNLKLAEKEKRYLLYIFLPSGSSGSLSDISWYCTWSSRDCAETSRVCTGIVGTMFIYICHLYLKHLELVSRYLDLYKDSYNCARTLGNCVVDIWDSCTVVSGTVNCTRIYETCVKVLEVCKTIVTS